MSMYGSLKSNLYYYVRNEVGEYIFIYMWAILNSSCRHHRRRCRSSFYRLVRSKTNQLSF